MENMKRAISAFMALVLVLGMLPGVPMFAGAEEVESQPETVAVETTETVTAPAETEGPETTEAPAETVPETTAAAETVPAETVPETTAAQETVPQETVPVETVPEVTVPAETLPEQTVPAETIDELTASAEAVDGEIVQEKLVEEITVSASAVRTYVGNRVQLSAAVKPADAEYPDVEFYVVEGDIAYNAEVLAEKGILIAEEAGTLTLAARAKDAGGHDSATQEEGGTVEVTFLDYSLAINEQDIAADNWYDADEDGTDETVRVMIGESLKLSVHFWVGGQVELPLVTPDVKWYLDEGDEKYATLTPSADGKEVTVTAKAVTETKYITLHAEDSAAGKDSIEIAVYPIPYKVGIYNGGEEVTNKTVPVKLLASSFEDPEFAYYELELTAQVWPKEAVEPMVWTCSDGFLEVKHPIKEDEEDTTRATVRVYPNEGSTTITISSKNYPDIKSKVTIERKWRLEQNDIRFSAETLRLASDGEGLVAGKSARLVVLDCRDESKLETLDSTVVKWELSQEDQAYATISEEGKLTARKGITSGKEVIVRCSVIGNEEEAYLELPVIIRPLATEVRILPGELAVDDSPRMASDEVINGKTLAVDTADGCDPFRLGVEVWPMDEGYGAKQDVKWTSSNTAIAAIDPDTDEIVWKGKNGTVTITAAATDGSGKKASVKLKFGVQVRGIEIVKDDEDFFLRSGQSWTFDVEFNPEKPTDTGLTWSLVGENDKKYASISSSGKLTAKTVYEEHTVTLRATAKDGSGVYGQVDVTIKPKKDGILTLKGYSEYVTTENNYVTKTIQTIPVGESIDLEAYILGDAEKEYVKWKASSSKYAEISDDYGESVTVTMLKPGTVTITATTTDGTNKKATVTLKGVRMTSWIDLTQKDEQTELACGKSLTLKAKAYDAEDKTPTISKLAWSIAPGGEKYAKVSSSGKVTAIAGALSPYDEPVDITVVVAATDGSNVTEEYDITIHPIAQNVLISLSDNEVSDLNVTGRTYTYIMETPGADTVQMSAAVWSENAIQNVTWKSSNAKVASIDKESGEITCNKAGTVTITATAADGSAKKATFKLTIVLRPTGVYFDKLGYGVIAGGKSLKIKPVLVDGNGNKVTGKKLEWNYEPYPGDTEEDGTAYVTSLSGGTLKTKKVTEPKRVLVTLKTQEKYESWESELFAVVIYIYPATSSVQITYNGKDAGKTIWAQMSQGGLTLDGVAKSNTGDEPFQYFTWKSSNTKIAEVDAYTGEVTFKKAGTVTIYATSADGTSKKDSVKITIRE